MPTGYTSEIYNGNTSLRDYILACSRGMGFLMHMRDSGPDAEIPRTVEPDTYHQDKISEAQEALERLFNLSLAEVGDESRSEYDTAVLYRRKSLEQNDKLRVNYTEMIAEVEAWECPEKLSGLKKLMLEQLTSALDFDVSDMTSPNSFYKPPGQLSAERWLAEKLAAATKDVAYHTKAWEKELARNEERNEYLTALWECLPDA